MHALFIKNALSRGESGKEWIEAIPSLIKTYEKKWSLTVLPPFDLSYNYVAPAKRRNGEMVVLKLGFPSDPEFISEVHALQVFDGKGAVKLLQHDLPNCVALLEYLQPGQQLQTLKNNIKETEIAAIVAQNLWQDIPKESGQFITLEKWFEAFARYKKRFGTSGPIPEDIFVKGETLFLHLLQTTENPQLIHGDFHHMNILSSGTSWKTIDAKGVIGDPMYDLAVFLHNPLPDFLKKPNAKALVMERIGIFSQKLGFDKKRIIHWGIAQSVLSALWDTEDKGIWKEGIDFVRLLESLYK